MTHENSVSRELERQGVVHMECTIPSEMTIDDWRRERSERRRSASRRSSRLHRAAARRVVPLRPVPCDHLHDQTSRYDPVQKQLSFLLVCSVCGTEKLVQTVPYEPRFQPHAASEPAGATVHRLPVPENPLPARRAA
jgi:hypothetical protein